MSPKTKILIAEDEVVFVMSLKRDLVSAGYDLCEPVSSGPEAIESVMADNPDLILLDYCLGGPVDGIEIATRIRSFSPVPIIFMSGYPNEQLKDRIDAVPGSILLAKPFTPKMLAKAIEQSLE